MVRTDSRITEGQTHTHTHPHSTALGSVETYSPRVKRREQKLLITLFQYRGKQKRKLGSQTALFDT